MSFPHRRDHHRYARTSILNQARLLQQAHEELVASSYLVLQVFFVHRTVEAPWRDDLQSICVHLDPHLGALGMRAVIAMGDGVDDGLAHCLFRVLKDRTMKDAVDQRALPHVRLFCGVL